jgi:hypothetical protein
MIYIYIYLYELFFRIHYCIMTDCDDSPIIDLKSV